MLIETISQKLIGSDFKNMNDFIRSFPETGHAYERIFDLMQRRDIIPELQAKKGWYPVYGSYGNKKYTPKTKTLSVLNKEKINNSSSQGGIDLVLVNHEEKKTVSLSFKFFESEKAKNIQKYDLDKMFFCNLDLQVEFPGYRNSFGIVTNCGASDLQQKMNKCRSKGVDKIDFISTKENQDIYLRNFKRYLNEKETVCETSPKNIYNRLRFHQQYCAIRIQEVFKNYQVALLGALARSGKTYIAGCISLNGNYRRVLYISDVVTNLKEGNQDFFNSSDFDEFDRYIYTNLKKLNLSKTKRSLVVSSSQSLKKNVLKEHFDLIIIDEAHIGGATDKIKESIKKISEGTTKILYMTATFGKIRDSYNLRESQCVLLGIDMVAKLTSNPRSQEAVKEVEGVLGRELQESELKELVYPFINYMFLDIQENYLEKIKEALVDDGNTLFTNSFKMIGKNFTSQGLRQIEIVCDKVFKRKDTIVTGNDCITRITNEKLGGRKPRAILVYLPAGQTEMKTDQVLPAFKSFFDNRYDLELYVTVCVFSGQNDKDVKAYLDNEVRKNPDKTVIILVYKMLQTAITLLYCDGVILFDDSKSCDELTQRVFRCATYEKGKENVFVIDINPDRIFTTILDYGFSRNLIKTKDDCLGFMKGLEQFIKISPINKSSKRFFKLHDNLVNIGSTNFSFKDDDFLREHISSFLSSKSSYDYLQNLIGLLKINESFLTANCHFKKSKTEQVFKRLDLKNKKGVMITIPENVELQISEPDQSTKKIDEEAQRLENQKNYEAAFSVILNLIIILHSKYTQDIGEILKLIDYDEIMIEISKNYSYLYIPKEDFERHVLEDYKDYLQGYIVIIKHEMENKTNEEIYNFISKCLTPNQAQKEKNGEVFTPLSLVNQMLDKLPEEVWSNPNLKWLDPAVGIGNFPLVVHQRLMVGLVDCFPNESDRNEHILKEMIYAVDITPLNICQYKMVMQYPKDYSGSNIVVGSFLDPQTLPNCKFDVIIGNPPYNASGSTNTGNTLWNKFVEESLNRLNDDGFLTFVHPNGWRKPASERSRYRNLFKKMTFENSLLYLEIHHVSDGLETFKARTRYDWYVLKRQRPAKGFLTPIKDETGNQVLFDTHKWDWLPNLNFELIEPLLGDGCDIIYSSSKYGSTKKHVSYQEDEKFKHPIVHSITKKGVRLLYSSHTENGLFGVSKVIFGDHGMNDVIIDMEGNYGMSEDGMAIKVDTLEEAQKIKSALLSKNFKKVLKSSLWSSFRIDWRLFTYLKHDFYDYVE